MTKRLVGSATMVAAAVALTGCYTILQAPRSFSSDYESDRPGYSSAWENEREDSPLMGDYRDDRDANNPFGYSPYGGGGGYGGYGSGGGFPALGYDSRNGLYGFGSPYGYGSGYGGGYGANSGPYGYGYDPYYSGAGGSYVPPGYQLVTTQELANLRAENAALQSSSFSDTAIPTLNQTQLTREQQRAWEQRTPSRTQPTATRKSTASVRTPKSSSSSSSTVSKGGSSKSAKSKSSGSSTAKRRKTRR